MTKHNEHSDALELIAYGLAKFAGKEPRKNVFANKIAKNRNAFFQMLVDKGIATSKSAVSTRQDNFDPFFDNSKKGFLRDDIVKRYSVIKARIDAVVGTLKVDEYVDFVNALIANECGEKVSKQYISLIEISKKAVFEEIVLPVERIREYPDDSIEESEKNRETAEDTRLHTQIQWELIQLGRKMGCDVYVASNDRNRKYKGNVLGNFCLSELPQIGIDDATARIISMIDVVWIKNGMYKCAFEVECTTTIYSGILRMSDLFCSAPNFVIDGYIVIPDNEKREKKVKQELNRPTFRDVRKKIKYCLDSKLSELYDFAVNIPDGMLDVKILESYANNI